MKESDKAKHIKRKSNTKPRVRGVVRRRADATRKRAEEALRQSAARFSTTFHSSPSPIVITRVEDGKFIDVNEAGCQLFGYTREQLIGRTSIELGITNAHTRKQIMDTLKAKGIVRNIEATITTRTGEQRDVLNSIEMLDINSEACALSTFIDITDRKHVEEALRESEQRLASIYNTVGDVIFHLAVGSPGQFRFASVNRAFLRVTGLSEESVVGKTVYEVIPEPSLTMVLDKYRQAIEENTIVRWEETSDYPTGRLTGEVSVAPVFDDKGICTHLVGSVHDITERKRAEAER